MITALEVLAHCAAVAAMVLFVAWVATLLVGHPTTYRDGPIGRRPPAPRCSGQSEESYQRALDKYGETWYCACGSKTNVPRHQNPECAGWKMIDNKPECPECLGIKRAVWHGEEDEAA